MNKHAISRQLSDSPWIKKAAVFLRALDHALENVKSSTSTYETCKEAIDLCRQWLSKENVRGDALAYYLDADEVQNGPLAESHFAAGSVEQDSLILIVLVVGFFAHRAYKVSGQQASMSASVSEADEGSAEYIVDFIDKVGLLGVLEVH